MNSAILISSNGTVRNTGIMDQYRVPLKAYNVWSWQKEMLNYLERGHEEYLDLDQQIESSPHSFDN